MANKPQFIILHHTAVSYAKNPDQYEATKKYHIGKGWGNIGYHYEIAKNGKVYPGRKESEVGAHCKEQSMNYKSIGIALDGNFDIELPTAEQIKSLTDLLKDLMKRYNIPADNIFPHRKYATYKSCYGKKLSDDWAKNLVKPIATTSSTTYDEAFINKWSGRFLLDVDEKGRLYYVFNGKRNEIPKGMSIQEFATKFATGFRHSDILKIPQA